MRVHKKSVLGVFVVTGAFVAVMLTGHCCGLFYNDTPSIPEGFWISSNKAAPEIGDFVAACPPLAAARLARARDYLPAGRCPGDTVPLLKQVYATPFDLVLLTGDSLRIQHQQESIIHPVHILKEDPEGRPLSPARGGVLSPSQYWLGSSCPIGFDSRYFGAVERENIISVIRPLFTW